MRVLPSALTTPELLTLIFECCDSESNKANALVCKLWATVGRPVIWRELTGSGFKILLRKLAPWTFTRPFEPPGSLDQPHFLEFSRLVRSLRVVADPAADTVPVLNFILNAQPAVTIPNLLTLTCSVNNGGEDFFEQLCTFVKPELKRCTLNLPYKCSDKIVGRALQSLSGLTYLHLRERHTETMGVLFTALQELPSLATLVLPRYTLTPHALVLLSTLPALREIKYHSQHYESEEGCSLDHPEPPCLSSGAFPSLTALTITQCPIQLARFTEDPHFPVHIRSLSIEVYECMGDEDAPNLPYTAIASRCTQLTEVVLRHPSRNFGPIFSEIEVFFVHKLTRLHISSYLPVDFSAEEVETLIHSLVSIEYLHLDLDLGMDDGPDTCLVGPFTFHHLAEFVRHCPRLRELGINLDTHQCYRPAAPHDPLPPSPLHRLDVGWSDLPFEFQNSTAIALAQILPNGCEVVSVCDPRDFGQSWDYVIDFLPSLRALKDFAEQQERAKCARASFVTL
ncbi:hypothetical protein DXG01_002295 [Tephrocybe rancida]|nr:hypothetical protein DXG01_002295 [Tephrocybe rancida]